jgi:hypothetical protein
MPEPRASRRTRRDVLIVVLSIAAAVAIFASPWSWVAPFSSGLGIWAVSFAPIFYQHGSATLVFYSTSGISAGLALRVVALSLLFAAPFLGLSSRMIGRDGSIAARIAGVLLLAVTIPSLFVDAWNSTGELNVGNALILAGTALAGALLLFIGYVSFRRAGKTGFASNRMFGVLTGLSGICLASIVLMPLGVILLIPVYATLPVLRPADS